MTNSREMDKTDDIGFSWGKMKHRGGRNKEAQFYESFTYDGVEYFLYDSVYLFKEGEPVPYIGKLVKIWEHSKKTRRVKVLWFFKPSEISYYLGGENVRQNELFLASGEGVGLANVNPLEAIAGKCNIICISTDVRNHQPSDEELEAAEYVFYRTFDVGNLVISDKLGEKIAAIEVKFLLNKKDFQLPNVSPGNKNVGNEVEGNDRPLISVGVTPGEDGVKKPDANISSSLLKDDEGTQDMVNKPKLLASENGGDVEPDVTGAVALPVTEPDLVSVGNIRLSSPDLDKVIESALNVEPSKDNVSVHSKLVVSGIVEKTKNYGSNMVVDSVIKDLTPSSAVDKGKSKLVKDIRGHSVAVGKVKSSGCHSALEEKPLKKLKLDGTAAPSNDKDGSGTLKFAIVSNASNKTSRPSAVITSESNGGAMEENPSKKLKLDGCVTPSNDKGRNDTQKTAFVSNATNKAARPAAGVTSDSNGGLKLAAESPGSNNGFSKKVKSGCLGSGSAVSETNVTGKPGKELACTSKNVKSSPGAVVATGETNGTSNGLSKKLNSKHMMEPISNTGLLKASREESKSGEIGAYGQVKEVTQRTQTGKSHWFNASHWDERLKLAREQGTLVLLQNLDPSYSSSEVEDIVWHGLGETCSAKMIQRTATSSPYSGEAFVVFKSREAAKMASNKLDQECLMLPNGRPLAASPWVSSFDGKQSSFPGHLVIDKLKPQLQREAKAVSTSHSSQSNTLEYEMAIEWRLLQDRADMWWKLLYQEQSRELKKLKGCFKSK